MNYLVIELQVNIDGAVGNIVTAYDNRSEAESHYHTVLAAAAVSSVPKHSAVLIDDEGAVLGSMCYQHWQE